MLPRRLLLVALALATSNLTWAQPSKGFDDSSSNLMVVLRESKGANKPDETLVPIGKVKVKLEDGKDVEMDPGWFAYIGDMHIRFVFDSPDSMRGATPTDLQRLHLTPQAALALAVTNMKRVYGEASATPFWEGTMSVESKSPDLISSYFLDRDYWRQLNKQHPEGLVVCVAKRGGMAWAPASNARAVQRLRQGVEYLYTSSGRLRVSSALYLFKDDKWSVFQAPVAK